MPARQKRSTGHDFKETLVQTPTRSSVGLLTESPHWVSGNEVVFNTPSSWSPITMRTRRRTTMIQEEIIVTRNDVVLRTKGKRQVNDSEFKVPSLMFSSPPGVKTRNRRSSIYAAAPKPPAKQTSQNTKNSSSNARKMGRPTKAETVVKRGGKPSSRNMNRSKLTSEKVLLSSSPLKNKRNGQSLSKSTRRSITRTKMVKEESGTTKKTPKGTKRKSTEKEIASSPLSPNFEVEKHNMEMLSQSSKRPRKSVNTKTKRKDENEESMQTNSEEVFTTIKAKTPKSALKVIPKSSPRVKTPGRKEKQLSSVQREKTTRSTRKSEPQFRKSDEGNFNENNGTPLKMFTPSSFNRRKSLLREKMQNSVLSEVIVEHTKTMNENRTHLEEKWSTPVSRDQQNNRIQDDFKDEFVSSDEQDNTLDKTDLNMTFSRSSNSKWCTIL